MCPLPVCYQRRASLKHLLSDFASIASIFTQLAASPHHTHHVWWKVVLLSSTIKTILWLIWLNNSDSHAVYSEIMCNIFRSRLPWRPAVCLFLPMPMTVNLYNYIYLFGTAFFQVTQWVSALSQDCSTQFSHILSSVIVLWIFTNHISMNLFSFSFLRLTPNNRSSNSYIIYADHRLWYQYLKNKTAIEHFY